MNQSEFGSLLGHVVFISRCDRWQAFQQLQEMGIACHCSEDGLLRVEVDSPIAALLVKSVVWRLKAPRSELVDWLERCWQQHV